MRDPMQHQQPDEHQAHEVLAGLAGEQLEQERPTVPPALEDYTAKWMEETADSADFTDSAKQYEQDLKSLFPGEADRKRAPVRGRRTRKESRMVDVPRVFRNSQQTLAMICPGDHQVRFTPRKEIPPLGGGRATVSPRDQWVHQFAITATDRVDRASEEIRFRAIVRSVFRHGIWFRNGVLKLAYQRDFHLDPIVVARNQDAQDNLARLQYLLELFLRGDICSRDAEYQEILSLKQSLAEGDEIEVWQGPVADMIPMNRFKADPRIDSIEKLPFARWQGDTIIMTAAELLARFPFKRLAQPDAMGRDWEGIHPDDLTSCSQFDANGRKLTEQESERRRQETKRQARAKSGKLDVDDNTLFGVFECWSQSESKVLWLVDGLKYPADIWVAKRRHSRFFPYHVLGLNPQPGTWYGRSDTELQAPTQDRVNRKRTDDEKARWLSMPRGVADITQMDAKQIEDLGKLNPGEILKLSLGGQADITKALMWLSVPYKPEAFDITLDEQDMRFLARLPQQAMGVTDANTTATAINTANDGAAIASADKQYDGAEFLKGVYLAFFEMLAQEERPEEVREECGPNAFWPRIYSDREGRKMKAQVEQEVREQVTGELEAMTMEAQLRGEPPPPIDERQVDQRIAQLTDEKMVERFGLPEPLTREALFKRLQISVNVAMNGAMDRERRIMSITRLLHELVGLGAKVNLDPLGRLLAGLMGEQDEMGNILRPDPNALIAMLDEITAANPGEVTPEGAQVLARMGMLATQYLKQMADQQRAAEGGGGAGGDAAAGSGGEVAQPAPAAQPSAV